LALADAGYSATVLERGRYESPRIGETLPPDVRRPLIELGVWDQFLADGHLPSPGIASAWGQPALYHNDFIVNPHGPGWHVDRRRFDAALARAAEERGVEVVREAKFGTCTRSPGGTWRLEARVHGRALDRRATILVDATGRSATLARRLGGTRVVQDRLVGLVRFFPAPAGDRDVDRRTLIEAVDSGWWYSAPLPEGQHVAAFMTDSDLLPPSRAARETLWQSKLGETSHVSERLANLPTVSSLRVVSARSARSREAAGRGWLAVGDAAAAFDPLSSQGVTWALETGQMAVRAIDDLLRGARQAFADYDRAVQVEFAGYLRTRAGYYRQERRWPDAPFWRRRQSSDEPDRREAVVSARRAGGTSPFQA
jgi:flavin-dependent dehydrogenase